MTEEAKHEYWLEAALHSALGPPPQPKSWLSSVRDSLGLSKRTEFALRPLPRVFDRVSNKRIIITGLDDVGKSTILRNYISLDAAHSGKDIETRIPFIGLQVERVCYPSYNGGAGISFHTIDVGGCAPNSHRTMERAVCDIGDAIVWVVDATDRDRIVESKEEFYRCLNITQSLGKEQRAPVLILVHKHDREGAMNANDVKGKFGDLSTMLSDRPWGVYETEAIHGKGLNEAFEWLAAQLREKYPWQVDEAKKSVTITIQEKTIQI